MACLNCAGCTTDSVLGTEKVEACENCGAVRIREEFSIQLSELSTRQDTCNPTVKTPIQKLSIAKIDSLIEKLKLQNSKMKCHELFDAVIQNSKYKKRSRMKIAAACLVISSRSESGIIPISLISSELGFTQSDVGRFVMKISRDFKIPSSLPNPRCIFENLISIFFTSGGNNLYGFSSIQDTAKDLHQFTCELLNLQSRFPHIHACLYIALVHYQQNSAPNISVFCTSAGANKDSVQKYVSMITNCIVDFSTEFPIAVTKKNFFLKIPDILKHQNLFLRYSLNRNVPENIPELIPQSDPSHPIHNYTDICSWKEDESLSGVTDSEIENILLCPREVEQKKNYIRHNHDVSYLELFPKTSRRRAADV